MKENLLVLLMFCLLMVAGVGTFETIKDHIKQTVWSPNYPETEILK